MDSNVTLILILIILAIFYFLSTQIQNNDSFDPNNSSDSYSQNDFSDFLDYSQPIEEEWTRSRYNSVPAWNDFYNKELTIVGGNSIRLFSSGRKFRLISAKRNKLGNVAEGRTNMPYYYIETSNDGKTWDLHPQYSTAADSVSFEGYNVFTFSAAGGTLRFIRYPNGRLWVGNEDGDGDLHTIELSNIKTPWVKDLSTIDQNLLDYGDVDLDKKTEYSYKSNQKREPGLNTCHESSDSDDVTSALRDNNSML